MRGRHSPTAARPARRPHPARRRRGRISGPSGPHGDGEHGPRAHRMETHQCARRSRTAPTRSTHRPNATRHRRQQDRRQGTQPMRQTHTRPVPGAERRVGQSEHRHPARAKRVRGRRPRQVYDGRCAPSRTVHDRKPRQDRPARIRARRGKPMARPVEQADERTGRLSARVRPAKGRRIRVGEPASGQQHHRTGGHGQDHHHESGRPGMAGAIRFRQRHRTGHQQKGGGRIERQHRMRKHDHREAPDHQQSRTDHGLHPTRGHAPTAVAQRVQPIGTIVRSHTHRGPTCHGHVGHDQTEPADHRGRGRHGRHQEPAMGHQTGGITWRESHTHRRSETARLCFRSWRHARLRRPARQVRAVDEPVEIHFEIREMGERSGRARIPATVGGRGGSDAPIA